MRFDLSQEQVMVQDGVARVFKDAYAVVRASKGEILDGSAREVAARLDPLELGTALVPEALGGLGYGYVEAFAIAMESGRFCVPAPIKETLLVTRALSGLGREWKSALGTWFTLCLDTPRVLTLTKKGDTLHVNGCLAAVPFASISSHVLTNLSARRPNGSEQSLLVMLDVRQAAVRALQLRSIDITCGMSSIEFRDHVIPAESIVCQDEQAAAALKELELGGALLAAAETSGAARACLDMTIDYLGTRRTFGRLLGTNQLLRHRAADDFVAAESVRLAAQYASALLEDGAEEAEVAVRGAKVLAGTLGLTVAENSLQSHGAIGFTWEFPLHLFLRRILRLRAEFGSPSIHRQRLFEALNQ